MASSTAPRFSNSGTSQPGRQQPALLETRILLADYTTEELLAYVAHFSKLVRYYEVKDGSVQTLRTWNLGEQRSLLIIALIGNQRLTAQSEYYSRLVQQQQDLMATEEQRQHARQKLLGRIYKMAEQLDSWYYAHQRSHVRRTFQAELTAVMEELSKWLKLAVRAEKTLIENGKLPPRPAQERQPEQLAHIWHPQGSSAEAEPTLPPDPELSSLEREPLADQITYVLWEFHKAQVSLAALARRVLAKGLHNHTTTDHDMVPEMALLITFLELYQHAQEALNHIPRRHLDYYYQQVLRVAFRPARPDHAFLTFALAKGVTSLQLPAGTEVEGAKDAEGQPVLFRTTQHEQLSSWRVQQLSSLFVSGHGTDAVKGIYLAPQANSADGLGQPLPNPAAGWPAFGEDQHLLSPAYRNMPDATVGFAVSAAVLLLQEGRRTIELSLHCEPESVERFRQGLLAQGQELPRAFDALALAAFHIDVTGAEGWQPLQTEEVYFGQQSITWHLSVGREQAAIVPHQPELHAGQFNSVWPVLRLILNPQAPHYAYSCFSELQPLRISLRVHAQDMQAVQLSNQLGPLSTGMPFAPFGPLARAGAYLLIGCPELFRKRLTNLVLTLAWYQLPPQPDGFADHYQGYSPPITNTSFRVAISYRRDWRWMPEALPLASRPLFQTLPDPTRRNGTVLQPNTHLVLATAATADFRQQPAVVLASRPTEAATGAIRVELVEPVTGFGDDQYPALLAETMHYNARNASRPRPLPSPPFTPLVQNLWLSYTAEEDLDPTTLAGPGAANRSQFYHLHPLACYQPAWPAQPASSIKSREANGVRNPLALHLLPEFSDEGTLYIGLTGLAPPQTISLLFELAPFLRLPYQPDFDRGSRKPREGAALTSPTKQLPASAQGVAYSTQEPAIQWQYLIQDEWRSFAHGATMRPDVVHDQSKNFTELKPVYLTLPAELDTQHTILPTGLYWLRATVKKGTAFVSRVRAIHPQVVAATRVSPNPDLPVPFVAHLPPHNLARLVRPNPGLAKVAQPLESFGGRPAESHAEYNTRVSERLRHRGRAITPWDYEHLVLDRFAEVYQAKCLRANQLPAAHRRPGLIMVMVMPYQPTAATIGYRLPTFSPDQLAHIRNVLRRAASPQVQLEVCNPLYEVIQVRCQVCFTTEARRAHPQPGMLVGQVQVALSEFLSPWNQLNPNRQGLSSNSIQSFLHQLPYVDFVTAFSVVKMALEDDQYLYYDTEGLVAAPPLSAEQPLPLNRVKMLEDTSNRPWSVYVSAAQHHIEDIGSVTVARPSGPTPAPAKPTGIGQLVIGSSFVIPRSFGPDDSDPAAASLS